ncbi:uncharacterized protein EMH_0027910 [Eimeria mitis]|uniref:TPR domain-containing protein n=1 Tax=Eimeria mitis TaxID=44415 RepID=U6JY17_9EIME|nr:uncharacterized protein EMH_0027910 [Eimeria mitis]CDJ30355.1 hypothetical protein EMH_0027910 [Eimeria mitis]
MRLACVGDRRMWGCSNAVPCGRLIDLLEISLPHTLSPFMEIDGEEGPRDDGGGPPSSAEQLPPSNGKSPSFFVSKAEEYLSLFPPNIMLAIKFLEKGLSIYPNDVELLQRLAGEYAEIGKTAEAKELLQKAIQLEARSTQFSPLCFPISLRKQNKKNKAASRGPSAAAAAAEAAAAETQRIQIDLMRTYCSIAELYLTDLCDEPEAEAEATAAVQKALQLGPESPEALLCDAQLKKVKDDAEGALSAARCLYTSLKRLHAKMLERATLFCSIDAEEEEEEEIDLPSVDTRVNAAKLFVDVGMTQQAIRVLKTCLDEDDQDPRIWMVMSCALYKANDFDSCISALDELKERVKSLEFPDDHPMAVHEKELRELAQKGLNEQQQGEEQQQQQQQQQQGEEDEEEESGEEGSSSGSSSDDES